MKLLNVQKLLSQNKNLIFYKKDVKLYYDMLKDKHRCVYLDSPRNTRTRFQQIAKAIAGNKYGSITPKTIPELQKIIVEESKIKRLVILFNEFERHTETSALQYSYLTKYGSVLFISSFYNYFGTQRELTSFYNTFHLVNEDELMSDVNLDEVNVTYTMYFIIAAIMFLVYLKASTNIASAVVLIGGLWFAFLIFRTLIYVGGKV